MERRRNDMALGGEQAVAPEKRSVNGCSNSALGLTFVPAAPESLLIPDCPDQQSVCYFRLCCNPSDKLAAEASRSTVKRSHFHFAAHVANLSVHTGCQVGNQTQEHHSAARYFTK